MADYIVKDTELTSVANAIRTAGGTNSLLSFPNGFVSAVGNISGGGGGSSDFSTAEVTVINNSGQDFVVACPNLYEDKMYATIDSADMGADFPFEVLLYKGEGSLILPTEVILTMTATSEITILGGQAASISGNGTITIS